jgi:hypothetical protein
MDESVHLSEVAPEFSLLDTALLEPPEALMGGAEREWSNSLYSVQGR